MTITHNVMWGYKLPNFTICCLLVIISLSTSADVIRLTASDFSTSKGLVINENGALMLEEGIFHGYCIGEIRPGRKALFKNITFDTISSPGQNLIPPADVIVQCRWYDENGKWSNWFPENILPGGNFLDNDNSGLPDLVDIIELTTPVIAWTDMPDLSMPSWIQECRNTALPPLVKKYGERQYVSFSKYEKEGQAIIMMRSDRIPSSNVLTISGWNGWELEDIYTMGLMTRFHELDARGNRLNKIMLVGDDDWNEPGGTAPLHWRALSFQPCYDTVRLNIYAARLISSPGTLIASQFQIREDSLVDQTCRGDDIRTFTMSEPDSWHALEPDIVTFSSDGVSIRPYPLTNTYIVSDIFHIPKISKIGFSVQMDICVPDSYNIYDPSHIAWMSTYLELLDYRHRVVDAIKISACRPKFEDVLAAAGEVHPWARYARIRCVASHQTYLLKEIKKIVDGRMISRWRNIEVFKCNYPTSFRARLDEEPLREAEIPACKVIQIRARLLSDTTTSSPILNSIDVEYIYP